MPCGLSLPAQRGHLCAPQRGPRRCMSVQDVPPPTTRWRGKGFAGQRCEQAGAVCGGLTQTCRGWRSCVRLGLMMTWAQPEATRRVVRGQGPPMQKEGTRILVGGAPHAASHSMWTGCASSAPAARVMRHGRRARWATSGDVSPRDYPEPSAKLRV
jgi:hypothetical protein